MGLFHDAIRVSYGRRLQFHAEMEAVVRLDWVLTQLKVKMMSSTWGWFV